MSLQFTSNADQVDPVLMPSNPYALALDPLVRAIDKGMRNRGVYLMTRLKKAQGFLA